MIYPTLKASNHEISYPDFQINILENRDKENIRFKDRLAEIGLLPLKPFDMKIIQINIGKMCNQTCVHCHVDAGPDRDEIMDRDTMQLCLDVIAKHPSFNTVDLTGGAPEYNPHFRWFVKEIRKINPEMEIIVRSNLTIYTHAEEYHNLPDFFSEHRLLIISSMPCYTEENVNSQRGNGVFERSIKGLQMLNKVGYGMEGSGLELHLVYNPGGTSLPGSQMQLQADYKRELSENSNVSFNKLYTITNMPINRFLYFLIKKRKYEEYMGQLIDNFNPSAAMSVMCRDTISIDWQGYIYDCDFNQQLDIKVEKSVPQHIKNFDFTKLESRSIVLGQHCFGCTAGEGSSCQGALDME